MKLRFYFLIVWTGFVSPSWALQEVDIDNAAKHPRHVFSLSQQGVKSVHFVLQNSHLLLATSDRFTLYKLGETIPALVYNLDPGQNLLTSRVSRDQARAILLVQNQGGAAELWSFDLVDRKVLDRVPAGQADDAHFLNPQRSDRIIELTHFSRNPDQNRYYDTQTKRFFDAPADVAHLSPDENYVVTFELTPHTRDLKSFHVIAFHEGFSRATIDPGLGGKSVYDDVPNYALFWSSDGRLAVHFENTSGISTATLDLKRGECRAFAADEALAAMSADGKYLVITRELGQEILLHNTVTNTSVTLLEHRPRTEMAFALLNALKPYRLRRFIASRLHPKPARFHSLATAAFSKDSKELNLVSHEGPMVTLTLPEDPNAPGDTFTVKSVTTLEPFAEQSSHLQEVFLSDDFKRVHFVNYRYDTAGGNPPSYVLTSVDLPTNRVVGQQNLASLRTGETSFFSSFRFRRPDSTKATVRLSGPQGEKALLNANTGHVTWLVTTSQAQEFAKDRTLSDWEWIESQGDAVAVLAPNENSIKLVDAGTRAVASHSTDGMDIRSRWLFGSGARRAASPGRRYLTISSPWDGKLEVVGLPNANQDSEAILFKGVRTYDLSGDDELVAVGFKRPFDLFNNANPQTEVISVFAPLQPVRVRAQALVRKLVVPTSEPKQMRENNLARFRLLLRAMKERGVSAADAGMMVPDPTSLGVSRYGAEYLEVGRVFQEIYPSTSP